MPGKYRIIQKGQDYYPEYKGWFFWHRYHRRSNVPGVSYISHSEGLGFFDLKTAIAFIEEQHKDNFQIIYKLGSK